MSRLAAPRLLGVQTLGDVLFGLLLDVKLEFLFQFSFDPPALQQRPQAERQGVEPPLRPHI